MPSKKTPSKAELAKLDESGDRSGEERRNESAPKASERRKTSRRRQIDPTTCERDYTDPEIEFMQAMDEYKQRSGRMFPTCSEILEVLSAMGYRKVAEAGQVNCPGMPSLDGIDSLIGVSSVEV